MMYFSLLCRVLIISFSINIQNPDICKWKFYKKDSDKEDIKNIIISQKTTFPDSLNFRFIGGTMGTVSRKLVFGEIKGKKYLFVFKDGTILILDVDDPTVPHKVIEVANTGEPGDGWIGGLMLVDTLLYIAIGSSGIWIYNVSNPKFPKKIGQYLTGDACGVYVSNNYAYVADLSRGLVILDVSDPSHPQEVGSLSVPGELEIAADVVVSDTIAYIAAFEKVAIVNVSNPSSPSLLSTFDPPGSAINIIQVAHQDSLLYFINLGDGFWILDVSDPYSPAVVSHETSYPSTLDIAVNANYVFLVHDAPSGLTVFDVSNPYNPRILGNLTTSGLASGVCYYNNFVYIADFYSVLIISVLDPNNPTLLGNFYNYTDWPRDIKLHNLYAYVTTATTGLRIVDINDFYYPNEISYFDTPGYSYTVKVKDTLAYVCDGEGGLRIINIKNPYYPFEIGSYITPGSAQAVTIDSGKAYIADWTGLEIVDITNPSSPQHIGSWVPPGPYIGATDVAKVGKYVYLICGAGLSSDYAGLQIIDVSNPYNPYPVASFQPSDAFFFESLAYDENILYIVDHSRLYTLDISEAPNFIILDSLTDVFYSAYGICVSKIGNKKYAFISAKSGPIYAVDVTDPYNINVIGYYLRGAHHSVSSPSYKVACKGDTIYVTTDKGIHVYQFIELEGNRKEFSKGSILQVFYNPNLKKIFIRYFLNNPGEIELSLFDIVGRKILTLDKGLKSAGNHNFNYSLRKFNSGIYFVNLKIQNNLKDVKKLFIIK